MSTQTLDRTKAEAFGERMIGAMNDAAIALMTSIGHRTGLFDAMADMPPSTSEAIATKTGLSERYVREWLGAMVTGRVIEHDPDSGTYVLPAEHAACLTRAVGADNVAQYMQWIAVLGYVEDEIVEAFSHGEGVPYSAYRRFHEVMAEESALTVVAGLREHILPLVPGLIEKLEQGIDVLDVGCGSGRAMNHLAEHFRNSRFLGYDFLDECVSTAQAEAKQIDLANVRFQQQDAASFDDAAKFDLICTFDAVHDQADPDAVLSNIARALKPDGVYLMQDIQGTGTHHGDIGHPIGPFIYTISCMHCMSVSLANGGPGLGAAWGKQTALKMLNSAGFKNVRVEELDHDFTNFYYICTK